MLLIIFLIAVPVVVQTVPLALPAVRLVPTVTKPENVSLSIREEGGQCEVYWNLTRVDSQELYNRAVERLEDLIDAKGGVQNMTEDDLPEVHIRGDVTTPWRCIGGSIFHDAARRIRTRGLHFRACARHWHPASLRPRAKEF